MLSHIVLITRVMKDSLGGVVTIATISPSQVEESVQTLSFAQNLKKIPTMLLGEDQLEPYESEYYGGYRLIYMAPPLPKFAIWLLLSYIRLIFYCYICRRS